MKNFAEHKLIVSADIVVPIGNNPCGYLSELRQEVYKVLEQYNYMMAVNLKVELLSTEETNCGN